MVSDKRLVNSEHTSNEICFVGLFERVHFNVAASRTACTVYVTSSINIDICSFSLDSDFYSHLFNVITFEELCRFVYLILFCYVRFSGNEFEFLTLDYLLFVICPFETRCKHPFVYR